MAFIRASQGVVHRWTYTFTNAWLERQNGLFQAACSRAQGYRNDSMYSNMIYMIVNPAGSNLKFTRNDEEHNRLLKNAVFRQPVCGTGMSRHFQWP